MIVPQPKIDAREFSLDELLTQLRGTGKMLGLKSEDLARAEDQLRKKYEGKT